VAYASPGHGDAEDDSADAWGPQYSLEFSLLTSLRERERQLRRQRKRTKDPAAVAGIDKEIEALEKCKVLLKSNTKR
jgi:hypothetical protein